MHVLPYGRRAKKVTYYEGEKEELKKLVAMIRQELPAQGEQGLLAQGEQQSRTYMGAFCNYTKDAKKSAVSYAEAHTPSEGSYLE